MDTLKTDKTDTAEAENIETMELLTGMLDNATLPELYFGKICLSLCRFRATD